jgi:hypothetical protein
MTPSKKEIATYTLAGGFFALALAIGYFGYVLTQINASLPGILDEVAAIRTETIPPLLAEVVSIRTETIPPIIDQIEAIHEDMPGYFDRADRLVAEARVAGQQASEGAVTGMFTGIIKAPMSLVSGVGNALGREIEATDEDRELALRAVEIVLQSDKKGTSETFENPKTEYTGTITLRSVRKVKGTVHKTLRILTYKKGKKLAEVDVVVAVSVGGTWEHIKTTDR